MNNIHTDTHTRSKFFGGDCKIMPIFLRCLIFDKQNSTVELFLIEKYNHLSAS